MVGRAHWFGIALGVLLVSCAASGQPLESSERHAIGHDGEAKDLDNGDFNFGETLLTLVLPRGVKDTWRLKRYIRSEKFSYVKSREGDTRAIDEIFLRALEISHKDMSEALFISALSTMEHKSVGVRLPVIKLPLYFPLSSESDSVFKYRVSQLPSHFYIDSPRGEYGDRDKLQHFFGSAFLAYCSRSRGFANFIGDFIEWGEGEFIIDGVDDPRDHRANHEGQEFGLTLGDRLDALPSEFLQVQLVLTGSRTDW
ncbi:MAG: hypothetical protein WBW16_02200 [Bacteroidota bacterium]